MQADLYNGRKTVVVVACDSWTTNCFDLEKTTNYWWKLATV